MLYYEETGRSKKILAMDEGPFIPPLTNLSHHEPERKDEQRYIRFFSEELLIKPSRAMVYIYADLQENSKDKSTYRSEQIKRYERITTLGKNMERKTPASMRQEKASGLFWLMSKRFFRQQKPLNLFYSCVIAYFEKTCFGNR